MRQNVTLTVSSLVTILLMTFHMADDVLYYGQGKSAILVPAGVFAVLLYGTLALAGRPSGYIIILLGGLIGVIMTVVHVRGTGNVVSADLASSGSPMFFVWTLIGLAVTGAFTAAMSVHGLVSWWMHRAAKPRRQA